MKCPSCGGELYYHYKTRKGHQLGCRKEVGYVQITDEHYHKLKVIKTVEEQLKAYGF